MNIKHFSNDVQTLARAHRSGDNLLLKTSSGKLKENTLFERTLGLGKQLISKISGGSYELNKISYDEGKALIHDRFNAQLRFFSGEENFDASAKTKFRDSSDKFLDSLLNKDIIFSNPQTALASEIKGLLTKINNEGSEKTAFQRLDSLYSQKNSSAGFAAEAREFDALRGENENAVVSEKEIAFATKLGSIAERAHKQGATKNTSYLIAGLALNPTAFSDSFDDDEKYDIAVSTLMQSYERGVFDFEKMEKILPLKSEEALAVRELLNIRDELKKISRSDSSHNTANKNTPRTENNASVKKEGKVNDQKWIQLFNRATNEGANADYADAIAFLTLADCPSLSTNQKERYELAKDTLRFLDLDKLKRHEQSNSSQKLKDIYVLRGAEAKAERKLLGIRSDINKIYLQSNP